MSRIQREQGSKNVAAAGTAEPLAATSTGFADLTVQAKFGNTDVIYIGNSSVGSSNGIVLQPGATVDLNGGDLNDVFIDSAVNGEGVTFLYVTT